MAISRVILRRATSTAAAGAIAVALAGCTSVAATKSAGSTGSTGSAPLPSASTAATPMITSGSAAPGGATGTAAVPAGTAAPSAAAGKAAAPAGIPACTGDQIEQSLGAGNGAGGYSATDLVFVNISGSTCTLTGYPGATVAYNDGTGSHWDATRTLYEVYLSGAKSNYSSPPIVTLAPGMAATSTLEWSDDGEGPCDVTNYTALLTTTPNTKSTVTWGGSYTCADFMVMPVVAAGNDVNTR